MAKAAPTAARRPKGAGRASGSTPEGRAPSGSTWHHRPYQPDQRPQDEARTNSHNEQSNFMHVSHPVGINSLRSHSTVGKVFVDPLGNSLKTPNPANPCLYFGANN